ncbi:peptidase M28 [Actinomadura namibiensis]|uniref:Uncharacterized protein n=1 Tax=Actinomadura namibiensis TaxID=182080 RepID=A0A7W3LPV7_ACTNM|nr:peptidase M28 [Actinomadura namibiensis]MBA8952089.1 hypothetical protein [Actinomadura namibiensis]
MSPERFLHPVTPVPRPPEGDLRATVERLAARPPGGPRAAELVADRLRELGVAARVEEEPVRVPLARPASWPAAVAALAGAAGRRAGLPGAAPAPRTISNVVAGVGDGTARRTLVVMARHDAAPGPVARPPWWPVVAGPALLVAGAVARLPFARRAGAALGAARARTRPAGPDAGDGAGDGLGGVVALTALAASLARRPPAGLRVILFSAGSEGARGFARRHFPNLARDSTWFLALGAVGEGGLALLDADGAFRRERYDPDFGDLVARCALEQGIAVERGRRARAGTGGAVPLRHGYRTVCLVSADEGERVPRRRAGRVDYGCVADAARLTEAVARALAACRGI